uniref:DNA (cytosine-5-)-methyltransferase n=1 Tax=Microspora stagnorum TaxID=163317 RepID=U5YGY8_MICSG|nr:C-5 cytosine-specific DNA methyltransferase [Microspora stagnorum]AGZ90361.1 C-5 cytosine-specific DNA methyltransferase [Microspora stagnorum]
MCRIGGMSSGFINAGFIPLLLNDKDKTCCNTLQKNSPNIQVIWEDISKIDLSQYKNCTDVLVADLPCQSFSTAGNRGGLESSPGNLVYEFIWLVKEVNPRVFLLENVRGLLSIQKGQIFQMLIELLRVNDKYNVYHKLLNALHYGVPQKRERIFLVGVRNDIAELYEFPLPLNRTILLRDVFLGCPPSPGYEYPQWKREIMDRIPEGGC